MSKMLTKFILNSHLINTIDEEFELVKELGKAKTPMYGVIGHYMDILYKYGKECNSIAELGVQAVISSWAWAKSKPKKVKKPREINLYSPEYLQKKHGINLDGPQENGKQIKVKEVSFGFYNSLIFFIVIFIGVSRCLYFFQDFIIQNLPFAEFYLNYFFESMRNMFEIFKDLISGY